MQKIRASESACLHDPLLALFQTALQHLEARLRSQWPWITYKLDTTIHGLTVDGRVNANSSQNPLTNALELINFQQPFILIEHHWYIKSVKRRADVVDIGTCALKYKAVAHPNFNR